MGSVAIKVDTFFLFKRTVDCEIFHRNSPTSDTRTTITFSKSYDTRPWLFVSYDNAQSKDGGAYIGYLSESSWILTNGKYAGVSIRNASGNGGAVTIYICATNPFTN